MSRSTFRLLVALCVGASLSSLSAMAQPAPPPLETLEEDQAPAVTIRSAPAERQIIEKREQGRVTSVKVKSGKSTYELKPNVPAGSAQPGDLQSDATRPPQWQVMEFDLGRDQKAQEAAAQEAAARAAAAPPLPPPAPPANGAAK